MQRAAHPLAVDWFGEGDAPCTVFQWHYESFDLPAGATLLASSTACPHQAFGIGPHLAMQFHIEVDAPKIAYWSGEDGEHVELATQLASVQTGQAMRDGVATHLAAHQRMAARIYSRWLSRCES
jgi:GMP synthase-like glutamine amidotransferase